MAIVFFVLFLTVTILVSNAARVGVFVHGCNTFAESWESIVWGDEEKDASGRISQALALVRMLEKASPNCIKCVMWGSGVPSVEKGLKESEYTIKTMKTRLADARGRVPGLRYRLEVEDVNCLSSRIKHIPQHTSTNTITELYECFDFFSKELVDVVVLVSSSCHAPRCLRDASIALAEWNKKDRGDKKTFKPLLLCSPAETCYAKSKPEDVYIFEPPHIPPLQESRNKSETVFEDVMIVPAQNLDHHALIFHRNSLAGRILKTRKLSDPLTLQRFNNELDALLRKYE